MAINLVPETLSSPEDEQAKMLQQLNATRAKQGGQQVNLPQQKGVLSQFGDMAKEKVMGDAVGAGSEAMYDKGAAMFTPAVTQTAANTVAPLAASQMPGGASALVGGMGSTAASGVGSSVAAAPALTTLGTAMPYVGAGLLAGKALGFFNNGGHVGPLYASQGSKTPEGKSIADQIKYIRDKEYYDALEQADNEMHRNFYKAEGGMAGPLSKVKYKSAGGEVYELNYGGGPLKKEK